MVEIINGQVFIDGNQTVDPTLIGYAVLDFAETTQGDLNPVILNDFEVINDNSK